LLLHTSCSAFTLASAANMSHRAHDNAKRFNGDDDSSVSDMPSGTASSSDLSRHHKKRRRGGGDASRKQQRNRSRGRSRARKPRTRTGENASPNLKRDTNLFEENASNAAASKSGTPATPAYDLYGPKNNVHDRFPNLEGAELLDVIMDNYRVLASSLSLSRYLVYLAWLLAFP
jgi:hypothetical protein